MTAYLLLMAAACWHALSLGTIGTRGRIVHTLTGVGLLTGMVTGPAGYLGIGAALACVLAGRHGPGWLRDGGALVLGELARAGARAGVDLFWSCVRAVAAVVASPTTCEGPPAEREEVVSVPGETVYATPKMMRWTPGYETGGVGFDTAQEQGPVPAVAPIETYRQVLVEVVTGARGYNDAARYVTGRYGVSRSKFSRDVRDIREEKAA